jgi:hypothetical protein
MTFKLDDISAKSIDSYRRYLKTKLTNAVHLPKKLVTVNAGLPKIKQCHDNVEFYVAENQTAKCVRGWIVVASNMGTLLLAHSVIEESDGVRYEITPIESCEPRPFLEADLCEEDFVNLHNYLIENHGQSILPI